MTSRPYGSSSMAYSLRLYESTQGCYALGCLVCRVLLFPFLHLAFWRRCGDARELGVPFAGLAPPTVTLVVLPSLRSEMGDKLWFRFDAWGDTM